MGKIRIGIGGWSYEPWRQTFYPSTVRKADELAYASRQLSSIEINATFYRTQSEATFRAWRAAVPDGFVFSLKAPRAATYTNDTERAGQSVARFLQSGIAALGSALGPILWQFAPTRRFDADAMAAFLDLLPCERRHAIEIRHPSASDPRLAAMLRERGVARAAIERPGEAMREDVTADFAYLRLESSVDGEPAGYPKAAVAQWAKRLRALAKSGDVYAYVISGAKHRNPAAAQAILQALR